MTLSRPLEMFQDLGNQLECLVGTLKRGKHKRSRSNIAGLKTGVSHCERSRLRPICCGVNDLVIALYAITNRGFGSGKEEEEEVSRESNCGRF